MQDHHLHRAVSLGVVLLLLSVVGCGGSQTAIPESVPDEAPTATPADTAQPIARQPEPKAAAPQDGNAMLLEEIRSLRKAIEQLNANPGRSPGGGVWGVSYGAGNGYIYTTNADGTQVHTWTMSGNAGYPKYEKTSVINPAAK
jgi:hypothetical protein